MKVLVLMDNTGGVAFHRLFTPYARIQQDFGIEVNVSQTPNDWVNIKFKDFDCVIFNRWLGLHQYNILEQIRKAEIPIIVDVDDYWVIPRSNPAYAMYRKYIKNMTKDCMKLADAITCSTTILANKIYELNSNIHIMPNALDFSQAQWNQQKQKQEKFTIGWVGGITHYQDLTMVGNAIKRFCEQYNAEFLMCGYHAESSEWHKCEKAITGESIENRPNWFKTIRGTRADLYGQSYALFDMCIAPLQETNFNQYKSELKIVEASAYRLPIVVSDVNPYIMHSDNSGVVFTNNTEEEWFNAIEGVYKLGNIFDMGQKNHEYCNIRHNLYDINKKRVELIKSLCN